MWPEIIFEERSSQADCVYEKRNGIVISLWEIFAEIFLHAPSGTAVCLLAAAAENGDVLAEKKRQLYIYLSQKRLWIERNMHIIRLVMAIIFFVFWNILSWTSVILLAGIDIALGFYLREIEIQARLRERIRVG